MAQKREFRTKLTSSDDTLKDCPSISIEVPHDNSPPTKHDIHVLDINNSGIGISCEVELKVGQTIGFRKNEFEWNLPETGIVMWTFKSKDGFRAGIKFIFH